MCWVNVESIYCEGEPFKLNLSIATTVEDRGDHFKINYAWEEGYYRLKKTPEMVEAYNNLVPVKSQPVVPAEPDPTEWVTYMDADGAQYRIQGRRMPPREVESFRITGLGLYETQTGKRVRICGKDVQDRDLPWVTDDQLWYSDSGVWCGGATDYNIVKLIKLDEVQP